MWSTKRQKTPGKIFIDNGRKQWKAKNLGVRSAGIPGKFPMETRGPLDALNAIALTSTVQRRIEAMLAGAEEAVGVRGDPAGDSFDQSAKNFPERKGVLYS